MTTALIDSPRIAPRTQALTDDELARAAGSGDVAAFEALYERHHRPLLSFSRHMLGRVHDAEDVVQHTFAAADAAFREGRVPASVRAWLYTVARNRCISLLRARRDDQAPPDAGVPSAANLAEEVEQREDLRALLADLRTLRDDQRAALLLAELGELSHAEVAQVLGVRARKVKALVYQARQALLAAASARAIPCRSIQEELAVASGAARRRRHLRDHVARCDGCRAYAASVARQRASIAAILPVAPTIALRDGVLACLGGGGAAAATGGAGAGLGALGAKLLAIAAIGGAAAGGGTIAVTQLDPSGSGPHAARSGSPAPIAPAGVGPAAPATLAPKQAAPVRVPARSRREAGQRRAEQPSTTRAAQRSTTRVAPPARTGNRGTKRAASPGLALGLGKRQARGDAAAKDPPGKPETTASKSQAPQEPPSPPAAKPARSQPAPPVLSPTPEAARTEPSPPAQAQSLEERQERIRTK